MPKISVLSCVLRRPKRKRSLHMDIAGDDAAVDSLAKQDFYISEKINVIFYGNEWQDQPGNHPKKWMPYF